MTWGNGLDWFYGGRGILSLANELWTSKNLYKTSSSPSGEQKAEFIEYVLMTFEFFQAERLRIDSSSGSRLSEAVWSGWNWIPSMA